MCRSQCSDSGAERGVPPEKSFSLAAQLLSGLLQGATDSDGARWRSNGLDRLALDMAQRLLLGQGEVPTDLCRSLALLLGGSGSLPLGHKCAKNILGRLCTAVGDSDPGVAGCAGAAASASAVVHPTFAPPCSCMSCQPVALPLCMCNLLEGCSAKACRQTSCDVCVCRGTCTFACAGSPVWLPVVASAGSAAAGRLGRDGGCCLCLGGHRGEQAQGHALRAWMRAVHCP